MDYADADYKDLYVEGPMGYRKLSENKANDKKNQSNESGLWIKELKNICLILKDLFDLGSLSS